jgi:4-amino-4-deoxy-L-arabinose transferase-like glycosyltransferase
MRRSQGVLIVVVAAAIPRLVVLARERERVLEELGDSSDRFATTLADHGTFGFLRDVPSAYIEPLYAWLLAGLYFPFGHSWLAVGLAQTAVAVATALIVMEIGRRLGSTGVGVTAAVLTTLHPYLVWHDVHANRDVVEGLLLALVVLIALAAYELESPGWAAVAGGVAGLAILVDVRLVALPLVLAVYLAWRIRPGRDALFAFVAVVAGAALVVTPWVIRNEVEVGCYTLTTDTRTLWKANNLNTRAVLDGGGWIDDVPDFPGAPPTPDEARVDECAQMRVYRERVLDFWQDHPREKGRLAVQATRMLWNPFPVETGTSDRGFVGTVRDLVEPAFVILLYATAIAGLLVAPGRFVALALLLLAYSTLAAVVFAGATRYRVPWDFLLALLAAFAVARIWERYGLRRWQRRRPVARLP